MEELLEQGKVLKLAKYRKPQKTESMNKQKKVEEGKGSGGRSSIPGYLHRTKAELKNFHSDVSNFAFDFCGTFCALKLVCCCCLLLWFGKYLLLCVR